MPRKIVLKYNFISFLFLILVEFILYRLLFEHIKPIYLFCGFLLVDVLLIITTIISIIKNRWHKVAYYFYSLGSEKFKLKKIEPAISSKEQITKERALLINSICDITSEIAWFKRKPDLKSFDHLLKLMEKKVCLKDIKFLIAKICEYLKLNDNYINLVVENGTTDESNYFPACFCPNGEVGAEITLYMSNELNIYSLFAVLVHELMHYFMYYNKFDDLGDVELEELFTDYFCVYLGFGEYMKKGYAYLRMKSNKVFDSDDLEYNFGYLSIAELDYAMKISKGNIDVAQKIGATIEIICKECGAYFDALSRAKEIYCPYCNNKI